jgi:hypothetical protein
LLHLLQIATRGKVLYYDTDSIWCDQAAVDALYQAGEIHETQLGKLKVVDMYSDVEFIGQKRYIADGKVTCAGIPGVCVPDPAGNVQGLRLRPIGSFLRARQAPGTDYKTVKARLACPYTAGKVDALGFVQPHVLACK